MYLYIYREREIKPWVNLGWMDGWIDRYTKRERGGGLSHPCVLTVKW